MNTAARESALCFYLERKLTPAVCEMVALIVDRTLIDYPTQDPTAIAKTLISALKTGDENLILKDVQKRSVMMRRPDRRAGKVLVRG